MSKWMSYEMRLSFLNERRSVAGQLQRMAEDARERWGPGFLGYDDVAETIRNWDRAASDILLDVDKELKAVYEGNPCRRRPDDTHSAG